MQQSRTRGRPRNTEADRAILEATRDLLVADGYDALTMQAIADRAGVARQTVYRRWPSKSRLVADMMLDGRFAVGFEAPTDAAGGRAHDRSGSTAPDAVRAWLHAAALQVEDAEQVAVIRALASVAAENDDDGRLYAAFTAPGRAHLVGLLRAGVGAGDLRADADLDAAADAMIGAVLFTALTRTPARPGSLDALADVLISGLAAR
ncbi:transcriptional regulator, TetR family [Agromyces sp. CF514]|uniref:TetR/AcrR family transcriptional regulator n=1 Tax=Agromyces sp. CF514 TaxID=1881031 RepID=UPI0008E5B773|nr:TetR/AcrR family transcriptional regulator [Agromyces sp. CF514]SFR70840.1 transcriptional regulator, TetR family [Agromyces sp. CF514]